jgi:lipopolysaccharide biosynthesis glycosyltransferase
MQEGITDNNKEKINNLKNKFNNLSIEYYDINSEQFEGFNIWEDKVNLMTYNRFLMPTIKPNISKAIYLDSDIILLGDIKELYDIDLQGNIFGTTPDSCHQNTKIIEYLSTTSQLKNKTHKFFNAGVLLCDLDKMREQNTTEELFKIEKEIRDTNVQNDQGVLNKYCSDNNCNTNIDLKFNSTSPLCYNIKTSFSKETKELMEFYEIKTLPTKENFRPIIRHFTYAKPWNTIFFSNTKYTPNFIDWWFYCSMTDFYNEVKEQFEEKMITSFKDKMIVEKTNNNNNSQEQTQQKRIIMRIKLFNFIPFLKIKYCDDSIRVLLFNIIPIFKIRIKK